MNIYAYLELGFRGKCEVELSLCGGLGVAAVDGVANALLAEHGADGVGAVLLGDFGVGWAD